MQIIELRRQYPRFSRQLNRLAIPMIALEALLLMMMLHSPAAEAGTPVAYVLAEARQSYTATRVYAGRILPGRVSELGFEQSGQLATIEVDVGARVQEGQLLARLDDAATAAGLARAEAEVVHALAAERAAAARAALAVRTEIRYADLHEDGHVSTQQYDEQDQNRRAREAELDVARADVARARAARDAARIAVEKTRLLAPYAGIVQARRRDEGEQIQPGQSLLRLVEDQRIEAHVGVPAPVAEALTAQRTYRLRWRDERVDATLHAVLPEVDEATRTLTAVFHVRREGLPFGEVVELELERAVAVAGFWLPLTALTESDRGLWGAYVISDAGTLERRLVDVVHAEADRAFVRGTLSDGERVVSEGVQRLVPGQQVLAGAD